MDKKGSRDYKVHPCRSKKRKFRGNQHMNELDSQFASTSAKKLRTSKNMELPVSREFGYCILNFFTVFSTIALLVICKTCKKNVKFSQTPHQGVGFKINVKCCCNDVYIDSSPVIDKAFEINRRIVFVFRLLGVGQEGLNLFCGLMDICHGMAIKTYYACLEKIYIAASAVYDCILTQAVDEEKTKNEEAGSVATHLTVSGDGTWKKRGFSSLFGVSTLIGKHSKKVVDAVVKSRLCQACSVWNKKKDDNIDEYNKWYETHEETCSINHEGSAGKMEIDAITEMFLRSQEKHGVLYEKYIGDGDSKTFRGILNASPYEDITVVKKECVGHVEKRMGTRLRNAKKNNKGISGKGAGKLTNTVIGELTKYYGLAIRRHADSVEEMRKEIWATYYHKSSTDDKPQHDNCPPGKESWCKWRKAEAKGTLATFHHDKPPLTAKVLEIIKPIYEELSSDNLLERCVGAETQNNNESLNSLIWTFAPKHLHSGAKIVNIATFLAIIIFNEGFMPILKVMDVMGITIGQQVEMYAHTRNEARLRRSERRSSDSVRDDRSHNKKERAALHEFYEHEEGSLYGPGIAD